MNTEWVYFDPTKDDNIFMPGRRIIASRNNDDGILDYWLTDHTEGVIQMKLTTKEQIEE